MRPSRIALFTTAGTVIAGSAGLVWLSNHRSALERHPSLKMNATDVLSPRAMEKTETSRSDASVELSSNILTPSAARVGPDRSLINTSADASQNAMFASQKLIRSGQMSLEVKLFDEAFARLQHIASDNGGYIADIRANRQDQGRASGSVVVRVQSTRYFQSLDSLRSIGKVEQEGVTTQDVTKEYADLEARLTNKRHLEGRMREILRTRAAKMEDLLEAEQQLSQVTEQIEQMEGQRRYFQQMVSMSTITVELHEPLVVTKSQKPGLFAPVAVAAKSSVELLVQFFALLVSALVFLAPWLVLGGGTWVAIRRMAIRRKVPQEG